MDGPLEQAMRRSLERISTEFISPIMDPKYATNVQENEGKQLLTKGKGGDNIIVGNAQGDSTDEQPDHDVVTDTPADTSSAGPNNIVSIERHTNHLEAQMNHYKHITLVQAHRKNIHHMEKTCRQTLQPALVLEMTKANKREGGVVRRFESNAGEYARQLAEMKSARASSLGYIENEINDWDTSDSTFAEQYLEEIQWLKQRVVEVRDERIRQDDLVVEKIVQMKTALEEDIFSVCS